MTRSAAALLLAALAAVPTGSAALAAEPTKGAAALGRLLAQAPATGGADAAGKGAEPAKRHLVAAVRAAAESRPAAGQ